MLTKCVYCDGKGKALGKVPKTVSYDGIKMVVCPVCIGAGQIDIPPNQIKCAFCDGKGKEYNISHEPCPVCSGTGRVKPVAYK